MTSLDEARQQLSRALALKETGKADEASSSFAAAEKKMIQVIEQNDQDVQAHTVYARLLREQGRHDEAKREYQKGIDIDPSDGNLIAEYNEFLAEIGEPPPPPPPTSAVETTTERVPPSFAETRWLLGVWKRDTIQDPDGAGAEFKRVLEVAPDYIPVLADYSALLLKQKQYSEAEPLLARLDALDATAADKCLADHAGDQAELLWLRGSLCRQQGKLDEANDHFNQALALQPDRADWIQVYVDFLRKQAPVTKTRNWLQDAIAQMEAAPGDHTAALVLYREYARVLDDQDDVEQANTYIKKALAVKADDSETLKLQASFQPRLEAWEDALGYMLLAEMKSPDQAEAYYKQALERYPNHLPTLQSYAKFLQQEKNYDEAVRRWVQLMAFEPEAARIHLEEILDAQSENTATLNGLALVFDQLGREDDAEAYLKRSLTLNPSRPETLRLLASLFQKRGRPRDAETLLADNLAVVQSDALLCLLYAELLGKRREYDSAAPYYSKAQKLAANNLDLLAQITPVIERARPEIEKFDNATIMMLQGGQAEHAGRLQDAEKLYRRAIGIYAEHIPTLEHLIALLEKSGRTVEASMFAVEIAMLDPERAKAHYENNSVEFQNMAEAQTAYALVLQSLNEVDQACRHLQKALEIQPAFMPALSHYCKLLTGDQKYCEASATLERAWEQDKSTAHLQFLYGEVLVKRHQYEDAKGFLKRACELAPTNSKYANALNAYTDQFRQAEEAAISWILARQKMESDPTRAEELFVKSCTACQEYVPAFRDYGAFLAKQGRTEEAQYMLQRALELDPCEEQARQLIASLSSADLATATD